MQMTIGSLAGMFNISNWRLGGADIGVILGYLVLMIIVGMI